MTLIFLSIQLHPYCSDGLATPSLLSMEPEIEPPPNFAKLLVHCKTYSKKLYSSIMLDIHLAILLGYQREFYKYLIIKLKLNIKMI